MGSKRRDPKERMGQHRGRYAPRFCPHEHPSDKGIGIPVKIRDPGTGGGPHLRTATVRGVGRSSAGALGKELYPYFCLRTPLPTMETGGFFLHCRTLGRVPAASTSAARSSSARVTDRWCAWLAAIENPRGTAVPSTVRFFSPYNTPIRSQGENSLQVDAKQCRTHGKRSGPKWIIRNFGQNGLRLTGWGTASRSQSRNQSAAGWTA